MDDKELQRLNNIKELKELDIASEEIEIIFDNKK